MSAEDLSPAVGDSKPKLWLLVQCEQSGGNSEPFFEVVEASAVNQSKRELMHTGKTIEVRIGNTLVKATIFIISDDRNFLENELRQQIASSKNSKISAQQMVNDNSSSSVYRQASSYNDSTEKITFSLERNRKRRKESISEGNVNKTELSNHSTASSSTYINSNPYIPPMTFDQQTQTDLKLYGEPSGCSQQISAVMAKQEHIIATQQFLNTEYIRTKEQLNEIIEVNHTLKAMLTEVLAKIDQQQSQIYTVTEQKSDRDMSTNENHRDEQIVLFSCDTNTETNPSNQVLADFSSASEIKNVNVERIEISDESIVSYSNNCSQLSQSSSTASGGEACSSSIIGFGQEIARSDQVKTKKFKNDKEMVTFDWSDRKEDIDPLERIVIGNNQTTVFRWVMDQIKWTSHSHATRKLLTTLFTREVLASHSLTGKPSPGKCKCFGYFQNLKF